MISDSDASATSASDTTPSTGGNGQQSAGSVTDRGRRPRRIGWRSRDILRTAALVIAMYIVIQLVWFANALLLTVFMGTLFGLAVASGVDRLQRFRIPRGIGAALIVLTFFGVLGGFFALMAPTLREQSGELRRKLPEAVDKAEHWFEKRQNGMFGMFFGGSATKPDSAAPTAVAKADSARSDSAKRAAAPVVDSAQTSAANKQPGAEDQPVSMRDRIESAMGSASKFLFRFVTSTLAVFGGLLLIVFLSIYIAADPDLYRRGIIHLLPPRSRTRASEVLTEIAVVLRKWLVTQLIAMAAIGAVTTVGLLVFKVKAAFALGFIAALLEFIPTVGPILSAVPAVAMGFLDSPEKAIGVAILYVGIQFLENHILIPLLMKGGMDLPPALTIIAQALMALVFGFIGLLVAVPLTAAVMVAIRMLYVQDVIGDEIPDFMPAAEGHGG